jgi:hypothetical protein
MDRTELRQIPVTALFAALGVVLPPVFHVFGLGATFLPMFLPVMMGSMLVTWRFALVLSIICPLTSWLITGMPPLVPPFLPIVISELVLISLVISVLRVHFRRPIWLALIAAIVVDRFYLYVLVTMFAGWLHLDPAIFSLAIVVSGIPGIVLQLIVIPIALKLIEQKFPNLIKG